MRHFIFLFNKLDQGIADESVRDFERELRAIGLPDPLILRISSKAYAEPDFEIHGARVRNEFGQLEEIILHKLSEKRIQGDQKN